MTPHRRNSPISWWPIRAILSVVLSLGCSSATEPLGTPPLKLAFLAGTQLRIIDVDGRTDSLLTTRPVTWHTWATLARRVAYYSQPTIWVLDRRTGKEVAVGAQVGSSDIQVIEWTADGSRLLYSTGGQIHVVNFDGTGARTLSPVVDDDAAPVWSPDGHTIAFIYNRHLMTIATDGSDALRPLGNLPFAAHPRWSPDGKLVAVDDDRIVVVPADGSAPQVLATPPCYPQCGVTYEYPRWSSDGKTIAALYGTNIVAVDVDGTGFRQLVTTRGTVAPLPEMSPEGLTVAYEAPSASGPEAALINLDGSNPTSLGYHPIDLLRWAR